MGLTAETGAQDAAPAATRRLAQELLRTALLARLAVDLDDPTLARWAASAATRHARLLAGLTWPTPDSDEVRGLTLPDAGR